MPTVYGEPVKMNRDEGKELSSLWIRTITKARKKLSYEPHPPKEPQPRDNRPSLRVRRQGSCHVTGSTTTNSTRRTTTSSKETYFNLEKQSVSVDHAPRSVGHAHRRIDYLRTVHL